MKYIIKTKDGAFVEENSNENEINFVFGNIETTQHYNQDDLKRVYDKFKKLWDEKGFEVYKIKYNLERNFDWI